MCIASIFKTKSLSLREAFLIIFTWQNLNIFIMYQDDKENNSGSGSSSSGQGSQQNNPDRDTGRYEEKTEN